jgi:hypothetical protein
MPTPATNFGNEPPLRAVMKYHSATKENRGPVSCRQSGHVR